MSVTRVATGEPVEFRAQIQNHTTRDDGAIVGDVVWYLDGAEVTRVPGHRVAPSRSVWARSTATVNQFGSYSVTAQYENVSFVNPP